MSCWRKYTCNALKDVDKDLVCRALDEIGYCLNEDVKMVRTSYGEDDTNSSLCDGALVIKKEHKQIPVGVTFANSQGELEIQGDFWSTGIDHKSLVQQLTDHYLKLYTIQQCELNGYTVENLQQTENGIEYEAYAWA